MASKLAIVAAMKSKALFVVGLLAFGCAQDGSVAWDQVLGTMQSAGGIPGAPLSDSTIVSGLKQALQVGTKNAVNTTSSVDGFLANELIRINSPEQLTTMTKGLRAIGMGRQVDELEVAMNRAAEKAAGEATNVFITSLKQMSFADARGILQGSDTAATEYFQRTTSDDLRSRFSPIVDSKMQEVGLATMYNNLTSKYNALPFTTKPALNLNQYVTDQTLIGLFKVVATEEQKIRQDPAARVTPLLKQVFGSR